MNGPTTRVALIPARGGSKRLPRKNLLDFGGKPMLAWTVEAALASTLFDEVIVSTDDDEIAAVAHAAGAGLLRRPAALADDETGLITVVQHALQAGCAALDEICLLLPNCPLRDTRAIRASAESFTQTRPSALVSVVDYLWTPPYRAQASGADGLQPVFGDWVTRKSQTYPATVCPSGAIYWSRPAALAVAESLYVAGIRGYELPWYRGIDIDTRADFEVAAAIRHALDHGFEFST